MSKVTPAKVLDGVADFAADIHLLEGEDEEFKRYIRGLMSEEQKAS